MRSTKSVDYMMFFTFVSCVELVVSVAAQNQVPQPEKATHSG